MPATNGAQRCRDFLLVTDPISRIFSYETPYGAVHHMNVRGPHSSLTVSAVGITETFIHNPAAELRLIDDDMAFYSRADVRSLNSEFLAPTDLVQFHSEVSRIATVAQRQADSNAANHIISLTRLLYRAMEYAPGRTSVSTTVAQFIERRAGVCQDFAHLMLAVCRSEGIPARYVSGYLYSGGASALMDDRMYVSASAMHAWVECLLPDGKWHGFDPTNNVMADDRYVAVHYGRDYRDTSPIRGVFHGPIEHELDVSVSVSEENEYEEN